MIDHKQMWLLAGGNGAGKSTFYRLFLEPKGMKFINADLIARDMNRENTEDTGYLASHMAERLRERFLEEGVSFCFETVFSHVSKIDFVAKAKSLGYEVILEIGRASCRERVS
jgi:predicted ABC-type ATPase